MIARRHISLTQLSRCGFTGLFQAAGRTGLATALIFYVCIYVLFSSFQQLGFSIMAPWRAFWVDTAPFKGPQPHHLCCCRNFKDTRTPSGVLARHKGPRILSKNNWGKPWFCVFKNKKTRFKHQLIDLVTRPGVGTHFFPISFML